MDTFSDYNQIKMYTEDFVKTTFLTHRAIYAFKLMPFELRNAGSPHQQIMNKIFHSQLKRNMGSYIDDMIAKSITVLSHIADLK